MIFKRAGVCGLAIAGVVAAAVVGCAPKGKKSFEPADAFGLADANLVVTGSPAGILTSKFYMDVSKAAASMPMINQGGGSIDDKLKETLGLAPADMKGIVVQANIDTEKFVAAATSKKPIDQDAVLAALAKQGDKIEKQETHGGVDLLAPEDDEGMVMAFPKPDLMVFGTKEEIKKGIDRMKAGKAAALKGKLASSLGAAPKGKDLVVVFAMTPDAAKMAASSVPMSGVGEKAEQIEAVTVTLDAGDSLDLSVVAEFKSDKDAEEARKMATEGLAAMKGQIAPMLQQAGMEPLKATVEGVKIGGSGKVAEINASVPADIAKTLPSLMGMMQMMGGMGAPGGGMPPGIPSGMPMPQ